MKHTAPLCTPLQQPAVVQCCTWATACTPSAAPVLQPLMMPSAKSSEGHLHGGSAPPPPCLCALAGHRYGPLSVAVSAGRGRGAGT
jgi:hypothetical protein